MTDTLVSANVHVPDAAKVVLDDVSIEAVAAVLPPGCATPELLDRVRAIAAAGKRAHLVYCPGTMFIAGAYAYEAFDSSKKAYAWTNGRARSV